MKLVAGVGAAAKAVPPVATVYHFKELAPTKVAVNGVAT